ncbi:hypothetical protein HLB44_34800 [Aquincola sp. S2]|uniref:Uncharacterized protein n=1 Tax=Pseudaquabacterium terrae TaxID=2732868 RepID=A0ABX2EU35_9BURK|nr:hypothetical protein [Aquabacterium terrae]NRF72166.1 hypothetical protein [Aquabacterium terrae]
MLHHHRQAVLDPFGAPITDSDAGGVRVTAGPLQLRDRTVWWTGRVAIGLTHGRGDPTYAPLEVPIAAHACSEFLADEEPPARAPAKIEQGWRRRLQDLRSVVGRLCTGRALRRS